MDMDHVMADITSQYIKWYYELTRIKISRKELLGRPEDQAFPQPAFIKEFLYTPGFFRTAKVMAGSQEVMKGLNEAFDLFVVSAAMEFPQSLSEKYEWLQEHFPFIHWRQIIFCGSKRPVSGDYMIDDHLKNLNYFNGEKLLFTATHNVHIQNPEFTRVDNWEEIRNLLLSDKTAIYPEKMVS